MYASFSRPKLQPQHTPDELVHLHHIPTGATSNTPLHLWDLRRPARTRLDEVLADLMLEPEDELNRNGA
jgi:hypothetical protein